MTIALGVEVTLDELHGTLTHSAGQVEAKYTQSGFNRTKWKFNLLCLNGDMTAANVGASLRTGNGACRRNMSQKERHQSGSEL